MRVLLVAFATWLAQGCLMHDDVSEEKGGRSFEFPWKSESKRVRSEANTIRKLCRSHIGKWQDYEMIPYHVPQVNWHGKDMMEEIEAHRYVDKTSADEGKPTCELEIWIDSLAVKYMEKHGVRCDKPSAGKVLFKLVFPPHSPNHLNIARSDACDELFFIAGNVDGSLTIVSVEKSFSGGLNSPFEDRKIGGYKGLIFSADSYGALSGRREETVVASVTVTF